MSVKLPDFKTDFTEFLHSNISHTIKLVTHDKILECSGILLSQHSPTLKDMISRDNEVFLLDYQHVEDLLVLLYGGSVKLTLQNCLEIIKFSCQFGVAGVVEQVCNYLSSVVNESNMISCVRVCIGALKAAEFFEGKASDYDFLWPCEEILSKMSLEEVQNFVHNFQEEEVFAMFVNRLFLKKILPVSTDFVSQSNVEPVLQYLIALQNFRFVDFAAQCSVNELSKFFEVFELLCLPSSSCKQLLQLKKSVFNQVSLNKLISDMIKSNADSSTLKESLKHWRIYREEDIFQLCKYASDSFYVVEIILSWIDLNTPPLSTVKRLFHSINRAKLPSKYLKHVEKITKSIGYIIDLESDKGRSLMNLPHSFAVTQRIETTYNEDFPVTTLFYQCGVHDFVKSCQPNKIEISSSGTWISCSAAYSNPLSKYVVFGTNGGGKRIPFYSDPLAACSMVCCGKPDLAFLKLA